MAKHTSDAGSSGGGTFYASLTGPGETVTPGALTQQGSFEVDSSEFGGAIKLENSGFAGNGIQIHDTSAGGIKIESFAPGSGGILINDNSGGGIIIETTTPSDAIAIQSGDAISLTTAGGTGLILNDTGGAGVNLQTNPAGKLGFFAVGPIVQQATPVTLADVIALLKAYGLSA